jgi:hypothetical protein
VPDDRPEASLAVVDIDGVLADVEHRLAHLRGARRDWDAFFAAAGADRPLADGVRLARSLASRTSIVYLTGRPERLRGLTEDWLRVHGLPSGPVVMRPDGDHRPARMLKPALLARAAAGRHVAVVVDDDPAVCAELAARGFAVRLADWAVPDQVTLRAAQEQPAGHQE